MKFYNKNTQGFFGLVAFGVLLYLGVSNISYILKAFSYLVSVIFPFIIGGCMAFIINVPMRFFETKLFSKVKKGKRALSLILAILCIIGVLALISFLILPELANTLYSLASSIPGFVNEIKDFLQNVSDNPLLTKQNLMKIDLDWNKISTELMGFFQTSASNILGSTVSVISSAVQTVVTFLLGTVFAVNALLKKEKLVLQTKKLLYSYLKESYADRIVYIGNMCNQAFSSFLSGQCTEAVILGTIIFIRMNILRLPYSMLIAMFIGVTSLIPILGGFIGSTLGAILIFMVSPFKMVIFVIMFVVVQQIEGNLIYPHVVGNSVGLPAIWVLVAVTVGGNLAGVAGMFISIPACSVIYALLRNAANERLRKKGLLEKVQNK